MCLSIPYKRVVSGQHTFRNMISYTIVVLLLGSVSGEKCWYFGAGSNICVCSENHCKFVDQIGNVENEKFVQYLTSKSGKRFERTFGDFQKNINPSDQDDVVHVNQEKQYQTILGFGGAFTDSTGLNIKSLPLKLQTDIMKSYFGKDGIGYTVGRVPIAGSDFSTRAYSYDDVPNDDNLTMFKLAPEDHEYKIPFIKKAFKLSNEQLKLVGSAWSPPKWMKTNNEFYGIGFLYEYYYQTWANYYVKFLQEYEKAGIPFWGLTTGNEPTVSIITNAKINSLAWNFDGMAKWIGNNFIPTVKQFYPKIKLLIWDDQKFLLPFFVQQMFNNSKIRKGIDGTAVHWYFDDYFHASTLTELHNLFPDKTILATEASIMAKPSLGNWTNAERYAIDIIEDLKNWAIGWIDWNMVLDVEGGPTYIGNYLDAPIIVDNSLQVFYKQPMYYILGHFSKFVLPNSVRIDAKCNSSKFRCIAFKRPDALKVVILFNSEDKSYKVAINDKSKQSYITANLPNKSIVTVLYK